MKRILGIILAVLGCVALLTFLVAILVADGLTFGAAILTVLLSIVMTFVIVGWIALTLWLLS